MLGDLNPQTIKIDQQAVVYPGRDHVTTLTIKRFDGRSYRAVDTSALTRVVLVFPDTDPTIAYDSDTLPAVFDWTGSTITIDLSDYAMPASSLPCYLIAFDAEHPAGQVLVDNEDTTLEFDFRNVSTTGNTPAPAVEFITDAPIDGETYGRKDGVWVTLEALVSGVASVNGQSGIVVLDSDDIAEGVTNEYYTDAKASAAAPVQSVNGQTGVVTLDAADVGADPAGEAAAEVALHEAALDPHPQYTTAGEAAAAAPVQSVNGETGAVVLDAADVGADASGAAAAAVAAHVGEADPHPQYQTQAESDARYERGLVAGTNITIDRTNPAAPVISASGGGGGAVDSVNGQTGVVVLDSDDIAEGATNLYYTDARAEAAAPVQSVDGQAGAVNLSSVYAPAAHVGAGGAAHAAVVAGGASGFMTGADKTKLNGIATGAQVNVPTDLSLGTITSTAIPLNSSTGADVTLPAATTSLAGLQSAADKTKLDGVAAGATANSSDATLLARANHTGTQAASTISDFASAARAQTEAELIAGTNVTITPAGSGATRTLTIAAAGGGGGASLPVVQALSSTRNLVLADINTFNVNSTTNNYTATIPPQSSVTWTADAEIHFLPSNTGDIVITAGAGVSLNGVVAGSITLSTAFGAASMKRLAADSWWLGGVIGTIAQQQAALGLGTAAVANLTTSETDSTAGSVLKTSDFGVGGGLSPVTADLDALYVGGLYRYQGTAVQAPFVGIPGTVQVIGRSADGAAWSQLATACNSVSVNRLAVRSKAVGATTPWGEAWLSTNTNAITSENGSFGYGTGSGSTAVQPTSKATGVPLNKPSGQITTAGDALAANTAVSFTLTNNKIAANDIPAVVIKSGATAGAYVVQVDAVAAGSCRISIRNMTAGALSETLVLQFNIEKGAVA